MQLARTDTSYNLFLSKKEKEKKIGGFCYSGQI